MAAPSLVRVRAQTRARRIGVLYPWDDSLAPPPNVVSEFWKGLGWIVGETLLIERRYAANAVLTRALVHRLRPK